IKDERVRSLAKTVTASVDPEFSDALGESPAKVKVTLKNGQVLEARKDYATGSKQNPMSQAQLEQKFFDCAAQVVDSGTARKILAALNTLASRPSFDDFWPLIRTA